MGAPDDMPRAAGAAPGADAAVAPWDGGESPTSRLELVWGADGVERLRGSRVAVFGAGGVGSSCIESLARGGVGAIAIIDGDEVAWSNLNRQAIAFRSTVGRGKTDVAAAMVREVAPGARAVGIAAFALPDDVDRLLGSCIDALGGLDFVVDAIDTVATKLALASWARGRGVPIASSMGGAGKVDPSLLRICDVFETSRDPLARVMRRECRRRGIERLAVVASTEEPRPRPDADTARPGSADGGRPVLGTASYLPPIMGQMLAGYVIRYLVGEPLPSDPSPL